MGACAHHGRRQMLSALRFDTTGLAGSADCMLQRVPNILGGSEAAAAAPENCAGWAPRPARLLLAILL